MYIHLRQQLKLYGKYTFISTSVNFINANELSLTLFACVLTLYEQLYLWTIKHNKYTFNLAQWLITNTNRKSIAQYDNELRIRDIQQHNSHKDAQSIVPLYNRLFKMVNHSRELTNISVFLITIRIKKYSFKSFIVVTGILEY